MISTKTIITFLSAVAFTQAAPSPAPEENLSPRADGEIQPSYRAAHSINWSYQNYCEAPTSYGYVYRNVYSGQEWGQSALYTFTYPAASAGKQCWLEFYHAQPNWISNPAGVQIDVFTSYAPTQCNTGSMSNNRDVNLGRLNVPATGAATWAATYSTKLTQRGPCPAPGSVQALELVPVGDNMGISYPQDVGKGLRILYA
ncbi:hypothetical protein QBC35DRAFT_215046 [Podospora australis]|uniref:Ubiquitin 3 binding protein But2 C-terminal domain-containing protein n=1 Tax=Podospora australis TaxID=1536484 RepID=A0AAN6WV47_9PEZI|nr:hypothetical protein QBC35DRAFT_215046 [Podospora australis]